MDRQSLQEVWTSNDYSSCFGCGPENTHGLKMQSFWNGKKGICWWRAEPQHKGIKGLFNGGIIATLIDCHSFWTGLAALCQREEKGCTNENGNRGNDDHLYSSHSY